MTSARFGELVADAQRRIPGELRHLMENVVLVVEDRPSEETLAEFQIMPPDTLYGLYEGTPLTEREWSMSGMLPDRITIFREPILEDAEDEDDVRDMIVETVIHEFGHHFGLSEEEIEEAEALWRDQWFEARGLDPDEVDDTEEQ